MVICQDSPDWIWEVIYVLDRDNRRSSSGRIHEHIACYLCTYFVEDEKSVISRHLPTGVSFDT